MWKREPRKRRNWVSLTRKFTKISGTTARPLIMWIIWRNSQLSRTSPAYYWGEDLPTLDMHCARTVIGFRMSCCMEIHMNNDQEEDLRKAIRTTLKSTVQLSASQYMVSPLAGDRRRIRQWPHYRSHSNKSSKAMWTTVLLNIVTWTVFRLLHRQSGIYIKTEINYLNLLFW